MISPRGISVLYLEDDPDTVELVKFSLEVAGMRLTTADSHEEVMRLAKEGDFDLFLLDGLLPSGYSFDLCPELRKISPNVPIVFYTGLGFPSEVRQGAEAGADAYLVKPFTGDLAETLMKVIRNSRTELPAQNFALSDSGRSVTV